MTMFWCSAFLQTVEDKLSCHAWNVPLKERRKQLSHIALTVRYSKADIEHLHPVDQPGRVDSRCSTCLLVFLAPQAHWSPVI